jgi:hypothetical protein
MTLMRLGDTAVPMIIPRHDPTRHPSTRTVTNRGAALARQGMEPSTQTPTGSITSAASRARRLANTTFSTATIPTGSGASSRSSISLVKLKSITSGKAVLWSPVTVAVRATIPGNRTRL